MNFQFWKMQACGNDFAVVDARNAPIEFSAKSIQRLANRHFGIGFDSLLILSKPMDSANAAMYRVFNADGSEAGQCGNGARCIAQLLFQKSAGKQLHFNLETIAQSIQLEVISPGLTKADLAIPRFDARFLPIKLPTKEDHGLTVYEVMLGDKKISFYGVSLGNPHAVILVDNLEEAPVKEIGSAFNKHDAFPEGINVSFVELDNEHSIHVRTYERGVGETLACGSGACASTLVTLALKKTSSPVQVFLPGGTVQVEWLDSNKPVSLTGSAEFVFKGTWDDELNG